MNKTIKKTLLSFGLASIFVATPVTVIYEAVLYSYSKKINEINLTSVIPSNTDIGEIILINTSIADSEQVLSLASIWTNDHSQKSNWYPNQVQILSITTTSATIKPLEWSPNYTKNISTTVRFTTRPQDQNTLRKALTMSDVGSGVINLNTYKAAELNNTTIEKINEIKAKSTNLLIWLNVLYADSLYLNQIDISKTMKWDTNSEKYLFSIAPKAGSLAYSGLPVDVEFTIPRKDISKDPNLKKDFDYKVTPNTSELYSLFLYENSTIFDTSLISIADFKFSPIAGNKCTFTIINNEIYKTSAPVQLSWDIAIDTAALSEKITVTNLGTITVTPKDNDDLYYLVKAVNPGITINWSDIDIVVGAKSATLTAKVGSLFYTGSVTVTWLLAKGSHGN